MNPRHPFVVKLLAACPPLKEEEGAAEFVVPKETEDAAWLLFDMATMHGGFPLSDPEAHAARMTKYVQSTLQVESLDLEEELDPPVDDEEPPELDMADFDGLNMGDFDGMNMGDFDGMNMDDFDAESVDLD